MTMATLDRLFPGPTTEGHEQATLAASVGGLGWRRASDVARPANLGALVMATPKVHSMAQAAARAGLLSDGQVEALLAERLREVEEAYLHTLDERERIRAEDFLRKARIAAAEQWHRAQAGAGEDAVGAPQADVAYVGDGEVLPVEGNSEVDGGQADIENVSRRLASPHLQKELCKLLDCIRG